MPEAQAALRLGIAITVNLQLPKLELEIKILETSFLLQGWFGMLAPLDLSVNSSAFMSSL